MRDLMLVEGCLLDTERELVVLPLDPKAPKDPEEPSQVPCHQPEALGLPRLSTNLGEAVPNPGEQYPTSLLLLMI